MEFSIVFFSLGTTVVEDCCLRFHSKIDSLIFCLIPGLRNVKSQISSSFSPAGDFIISASEDSRVLVWNSCNRDVSNKTSIYRRDKQLSCEEFTARHVSVAIAWPGSSTPQLSEPLDRSEDFGSNNVQVPSEPESSPPRDENAPTKGSDEQSKCPSYCLGRSPLGIFGSGRKNSVAVADEHTTQVEGGKLHGHQLDASSSPLDLSSKVLQQSPSLVDACDNTSPPQQQRRSSFFPECGPKGSATWPEEKLGSFHTGGPNLTQSASAHSGEIGATSPPYVDLVTVSPAWGLVIVTAGLGGEITTFQNYGFPVRL